MTIQRIGAGLFLALALAFPSAAADKEETKDKDGFVSMFNGTDFTGWKNVNCHPDTFFVKGGEIITTGKPTGFLRTNRQYENFIMDFEWMHVNKTEVGNSGLFVWGDPVPATGTGYTRGIEVQVLVNLEYKDKKTGKVTATSHGDLFSIWGAKCKPDRPHPTGSSRCLPSEYRAKGGGEWNHYIVTANNGVIKLWVNGKEVSGVSECNPRKGYLALESEGAECHFRNLKIKELPSTNPKPEEIANVDQGFQSLFNGLDLAGWKADAGLKEHWKPSDGRLLYDGEGIAGNSSLLTAKGYTNYELMFDFRFKSKNKEDGFGVFLREQDIIVWGFPTGFEISLDGKRAPKKIVKGIKPSEWNRLRFTVKDKDLSVSLDGKPVIEKAELGRVPKKAAVGFIPGGAIELRNIFLRELK